LPLKRIPPDKPKIQSENEESKSIVFPTMASLYLKRATKSSFKEETKSSFKEAIKNPYLEGMNGKSSLKEDIEPYKSKCIQSIY
jgi:hypothetical protein